MSEVARHAGKTSWKYFDGLHENSPVMRSWEKARVARNRRRAEPAIVEEQLDGYCFTDPYFNLHDDTDVFYPGCEL